MMNKFEKKIRSKTFVVNAEENLEQQVNLLFEMLSNIEEQRLISGFSLQIGWSVYYLREENENEFLVTTPDYLDNPFEKVTTDLTLSLWVQLEQTHLLRMFQLEGMTTKFSDKIILERDVLDCDKFYLQRTGGVEKGDSGWYVGTVDGESNDIYAIYAYELFKTNPQIIKLLALPNDYMVIFVKGEVKSIVNADNKNILV
jgi:hypothetical protein